MRWIPQDGGQSRLVSASGCISDIFYGGERGCGKTSASVGLFQDHYIEHKGAAEGVIFRETYPELEKIKKECDKQFIWLGAKFNISKNQYAFPEGNTFKLRYLEKERDADKYQGDEFTFIAVDEAGNHKSFGGLDRLWGSLRSPHPGVSKVYLKTGNPGGPGHNILKREYVSPAPWGKPFEAEIDLGEKKIKTWRIFIPGAFDDNKILKSADPDYQARLYRSGPKWLIDAWCHNNWDIVAGGAIDDVWDRETHVIKPFDIPNNWRITRSLDWGSAAPFSVLWFAHSNGEEVGGRFFPKGSVIVFNEWYGGKNNEGIKMSAVDVAKGIKVRNNGYNVLPGAADSAIYAVTDEHSIADRMLGESIKWVPCDKGKGSRKSRLETLRMYLQNAKEERPGLYIFDTCVNLIEHITVLQRDKNDPEDVDTDQEDHDYDALTYELNRVFKEPMKIRRQFWK